MFCGLPISVAAEPIFAAQASPSRMRHRIEPAPGAAVDQHRRDGEADDVVAEHRRQRGGDCHQRGEEPRWRQRQRRQRARHPIVEAAQTHLRGQHHEREQQDDRRQVNRLGRLVEPHGVEGDERDRAQERDPGAIELEERQPPEEHPGIDDQEDDDDGRGHGGPGFAADVSNSRGESKKGRPRRADGPACGAPWEFLYFAAKEMAFLLQPPPAAYAADDACT